MNNRPNIIMIIWHDLGTHLSCYDAGSVQTPCLDRMAAEGAMFTEHFSVGGVCVPSRAGILTGRYPHATDIWRFDERAEALPRWLRDNGYATRRFGFREEKEFFSLGRDIDRDTYGRDVIGYEQSGEYIKDSDILAGDVCRFIEEYDGDKPYYACVQFSDIHRPNEAEVDDKTLAQTVVPRVLPSLPDTPQSLRDLASFELRAKRADAAVGRILDVLRDSGQKDDTLVVFTADHGMDLPRAKLTMHDAGTRVAMICWGLGDISPGLRDDALHSHIDIFPTLADLIGLPPPEGVQGVSFAPALSGRDYQRRTFVISEKAWESPTTPMRAIRTERWKYIRNYCPGYPMHIPGDYVKKVGEAVTEPLYGSPVPYEQLYDIAADPYELNNLAGHNGYSAALAEMSKMLDDVLTADGDPVLSTATYMAWLRERLV